MDHHPPSATHRHLPQAPPGRPARRFALPLTRSRTDRVVAGVAGGLGERLGIDPVVIRLGFVVLAFAGGFGVLLYLLAWLLGTEAADDQAPTRRATYPRTAIRHALAVGLVVSGALLLLREAGVWFGDALVWSVALATFGSALIWSRSDDTGRARLARVASRFPRTPADVIFTGRVSRLRILAGGLLVLGGMAIFLAANDALVAVRNVAFAVAVTVTGLGLILGPWIWRLGHQLTEERRERIRSQERAEMAAHLHDSVLQTLALIQRARDPQEMAGLARGQERELRAWLNGRSATGGVETLSAAFDRAAGRVERLHHIPVELVVVGDGPMDERLRALVDAAGEAMYNAARHSGAAVVSVYVEVESDGVTAYIRDQGAGFDLANLPAGRRGIAESIRGRMERHGGGATIVSERREGTEVHLRMPLNGQPTPP